MCDCAVYNQTVNDMMRPVQRQYWERLHELINVNGTYDNDDSFTVVLHPHYRDAAPPLTVHTRDVTTRYTLVTSQHGTRS